VSLHRHHPIRFEGLPLWRAFGVYGVWVSGDPYDSDRTARSVATLQLRTVIVASGLFRPAAADRSMPFT
jgi:hypothetical protein